MRRPSIVYGSAIIIPMPHRMFEFTVNMQKVRSPMWSKFTSYSVVRFIVTPMQTQTATTAALISAHRHLFLDILYTGSILRPLSFRMHPLFSQFLENSSL